MIPLTFKKLFCFSLITFTLISLILGCSPEQKIVKEESTISSMSAESTEGYNKVIAR